ncbi:MAG: EAL domain-containing protein [Peptococcaceae bacterium]|jgi:diguanylate cyclase (GGDEF)-like protein/PAS domain S-box-containing protein|nr:EAL domain-containing protein [Peptococcaceae bacterium]MDH7525658.1 EAL domain-containing protein [Peptococcaceae bacterium]
MPERLADLTMGQLIETFPLPFFVMDQEKIVLCNRKAVKVFGYKTKEELLGRPPYELSPEFQPDGEESITKGRRMIETACKVGCHRFRWLHKQKSGKEFLSEVELYAYGATVCATVINIEHVERLKKERKKLFRKLKRQSIQDYLTGLCNKRHFVERLEGLIIQAEEEQKTFAVMFIDLDNVKEINDTIGHHVGDMVLAKASRLLKRSAPRGSLFARYGGDEFAAVVQGPDGADELLNMGRKMLGVLHSPIMVDGYEFYLSASIGIARYPAHGQDAATLLKNADMAMYKAKKSPADNGRVVLFSTGLGKEIRERFLLEAEMRNALEKDEFQLFFQPVIDLGSMRIVAAEALLRWNGRLLGSVPPDRFIPAAEEMGLIHALGEAVLRKACEAIIRCKKAGDSSLPIAVNVSSKQLEASNFAARVKWHIDHYGLKEGELEFEITESALAGDLAIVNENIEQLKKIGIPLALDDFGTGFSSLKRLVSFSIDKLKIDKSFIQRIENEKEKKIVKAVLAIAQDLDIQVVAEGIETERQLEIIKGLGCGYGQGYLFNKPMPWDAFYKLMHGE